MLHPEFDVSCPDPGGTMKRLSRRAVEAALAEYFELFLTISGVLLAMLLTLTELTRGERGTALIFLLWLQGFIVWAVHRHGWFQRHAITQNLRLILNELVNDRLTLMLNKAELRTRSLSSDERASEAAILAAVESLTVELESLRSWEQRLRPLNAGPQ
jgi:hypothetical protein